MSASRHSPGLALVAALLLFGLVEITWRAKLELDPGVDVTGAGWSEAPPRGPLGWRVFEPRVDGSLRGLALRLEARGAQGLMPTEAPSVDALKSALPRVFVAAGRAPILLARGASGDEADYLIYAAGEGWFVTPLAVLEPVLEAGDWFAAREVP